MSRRIDSQTTRRDFLRQASAATVAATLAYPVGIRAAGSRAKINVAAVGVGGKGWSDVNSVADGANVVAFCDVDTGPNKRRGGFGAAAEQWPKARRYTDWRVMLDKEHKHLDGITVSTPDHMHAPITMTALHLGLGTYTQKPLSRTVHEARQLTLAARKAGVVTQMGNQHHSGIGYRMLVQLVQDGAIGKVREAHAWSNRPIWPQGVERAAGRDEVPSGLNWDLWLGVAPERPYQHDVYHPFKWRGWYDFGAGALGDMGCHIIDPVVWALDLGAPTTVRYDGPAPRPETFPEWEILSYEFPATRYTGSSSLTLTWYDGGKQPDAGLAPLAKGQKLPKQGVLLVGDQGVLLTSHGGKPMLLPEDKFRDIERPELEPVNHYLQWANAVRGDGQTTSHFDYAGPLTETVLLGTIAARFPNEALQWDSAALRFTNVPEANHFVQQEYRKGWKVEGLV